MTKAHPDCPVCAARRATELARVRRWREKRKAEAHEVREVIVKAIASVPPTRAAQARKTAFKLKSAFLQQIVEGMPVGPVVSASTVQFGPPPIKPGSRLDKTGGRRRGNLS